MIMTRKRFIKLVMSETPPLSRNYANFVARWVRLAYENYSEGFKDMFIYRGWFEECMKNKEEVLAKLREAKVSAKKLRLAYLEYKKKHIDID